MGRIGWIGITVMLVAGVVAYAVYSTAYVVNDMCIAKARDVVDHADPMDRSPPPAVIAVVGREVGRSLADVLSVVLLDRLNCARGSEEWMLTRPALAWQLQRSFTHTQRVALFSSTIDTGAGLLGLAAGARKYYLRTLSQLDEGEVECLVQKAQGRLRKWFACGTEGIPPVRHPETRGRASPRTTKLSRTPAQTRAQSGTPAQATARTSLARSH